MKNYFDSFYELIHKNNVKRRRMVSLLLVLSVFVSTGVLWELRDTVITMVNEPICGIEEHEHSDECYERVLVCGLEENAEHIHTDDCYEKVLVCGHDEHLHTTLCYTDEELTEEASEPEDNVVRLNSEELAESEETDSEEMLLSEFSDDSMNLMLDNDSFKALEGETLDPANPVPLTNTIDNIAKGIKFTLFDYGDADLEAAQNNYNISWDSKNNQWVHNNVKKVGINTGRDSGSDIMFFAYGTPAFTGTLRDDDDTNNPQNVYTRVDPDKNNYSGDYNTFGTTYPSPMSGNRPVQGIVNDTLDANGYPTIKGSNNSLAYLFSPTVTDSDKAYKSVYTDVNHLLQQDTQGHLYYNSNMNYAYYNKDTHDFTVYDRTFDIVNGNHHLGTDIDVTTGETYASAVEGGDQNSKLGDKDPGFKIGFFPFDDYDYSKKDPNFDTKSGGTYNHHFGMTMEATFINPEPTSANGISNDPVVFKYSGDDDMWVFVDNRLVLDIGGIHEPTGGMIDFTNGIVWVQDNAEGKPLTSDDVTVETIEKQLTAKGYDFSKLPMPTIIDNNTASTTISSESKWIVKSLGDYFDGVEDWVYTGGESWSRYGRHDIKMFYLERGGCYSNLAMEINLPTVKPLAVTKTVDYKGHFSNDYDNKEYSFTVYEMVNGVPQPADLGYGNDNPFTLKSGQRKDIYSFNETKELFVVETGVDPNIFSRVDVNGDEKPITDEGISSGDVTALSVNNQYDFKNTIKDERTNFEVQKVWDDVENSNLTHTAVYFKLYQTDSASPDQRKPVEFNGNMTFALNADNSWKYQFNNLPSIYGSHVYTYSVEEVEVPSGYEVAYSTDSDGNLLITNRDTRKSKLYLKKEWINATSEEMKPVEITLKRKKKLITSKSATITVNLRDPGNNLIKSSGEIPVYPGGSAEFKLSVPGNVQYYEANADGYNNHYYKLSSTDMNFEDLGNNIFKVSDLQSGANTVDIKVYTEEADDSLLLLHHSFTRTTDGWEPQGDVLVETSGVDAFAKKDGLLVKERTRPSQGARLFLDPKIFKAGKTYTFSLGVFYNDRWISTEDGNESNPSEAMFVMTLNDGLEKEDFKSYHRVSAKTVQKGQWDKLTGTITLPENVNPYGMYLLIETEAINKTFPASFRMDEFIAIEGYKNIEVEAGTGVVTVQNSVIYNADFNVDTQNWTKFANDDLSLSISNANNSTDYHLLVEGREETFQGAKLNLSFLEPGKKYDIHAVVSGNSNSGNHTYKITFNDGNGKNRPVCTSDVVTGYNWAFMDNHSFLIPSNANRNEMFMYVESNDITPYRIYQFRITEEPLTQDKPGYTLTDGVYTSNNNLYTITLQEGSVAMKDFEEDAGWSKTISLGGTDPWNWNSTKSQLKEDEHYRYIYYVGGETVNGATLNEDYILLPVENQYVASNDETTPILVKNKSIRFKLPSTGGSGPGRIYFLGGIFTVIGILSGSALYRRKRRRS
ncbi:carbohydrate binding domain-containing protein [Ruminococcus flavefaciens]|uniref:carbohydrate binding domain-containing protein n=1 Tax=Ruminococcus flavefaciens TaxID=1265 RepID=UPI0009B8FD4D|nr:carbohydrate binding domain-containing protein [Ruminococcus flavefaciens]